MFPRSIVITGANRGIGLGLVHELLKDDGIEILIATTRKQSPELDAINDRRLHILNLEATSDVSVNEFVKKVDGIVGEKGLNILINNAGVMLDYDPNVPSRDTLNEQLNVNTTSVVVLTQKMLPLLRRAAGNSNESGFSTSRAAVINISSGLASMTLNTTGSVVGRVGHPAMAYRISKAALNQFSRTLATDLKEDHILVVSFAPGWVRTNLGGPDAMYSVEESTVDLVKSFKKLNESHSGGYFSKTLEIMPW